MGLVLALAMSLTAFLPGKDGGPRTLAAQVMLVTMAWLFGSPFIYLGLASMLNKTTINADRDGIACVSGPLLWHRTVKLKAAGILQFFVPVRISASSSSSAANVLFVMDAGHVVHKISGTLPNQFAAHHVRHELQDFYGLEDMDVYGVTTSAEHPGPRQAKGA